MPTNHAESNARRRRRRHCSGSNAAIAIGSVGAVVVKSKQHEAYTIRNLTIALPHPWQFYPDAGLIALHSS